MSMKKIMYLIAPVLLMFIACNKEEAVVEDVITLSTETIEAAPEGDVYEVKVTSSADWRVSGLCDWARPLAESGKSGEILKIEVDPSSSREIQTTEFKVFSGSAVKSLKVNSNPLFVMSLLTDNEVEFTSSESALKIKLDTNVPEIESVFTGSGSEWIEYVDRQEVLGSTVLSFNVKANETYVGRETELTLSGNGKSASVKISQTQLDAIITDTPKVVHTGLDASSVNFVVRANVEFTFDLPSWLTLDSKVQGAKGEDGLTDYTIKLSFGENPASRIADLNFVSGDKTLLQVSVKQQNPNAVLCNIPDTGLRSTLGAMGWVLASETSEECEILEPGLTGTSLSISGSSIKSVYGLGAFPELKTLDVRSTGISVFDVSDCRKLEAVNAPKNSKLTEIRLGSAPVVKFNTNIDGTRETNYFSESTIVVSSEKLKELNMRSFDCIYLYYYDNCTTIDISACPSLEKFDAYRIYTLWGNYRTYLTTIYVSQAQMDAYNAGTLQIERVVKTPDHHEEAALVVK